LSDFPLSQELHSEGINLRYLGVVLQLLPQNDVDGRMSDLVRVFLLGEIVARVVKNEINALLRNSMMTWRMPMEAR
jgi:hypothetical protein